MNNQLAVQNGTMSVARVEFTPEQTQLIKTQIMGGKGSDDEMKLFLYQAQRTGLDPLTKQIYAIFRKKGGKEVMTIQTAIDGFRVIAQRQGDYAGQGEPVFGENIETEYGVTEWNNAQSSTVKKKKNVPAWAKITVYKFALGQRFEAATAIAYWDEYYPGDAQGQMWQKMPHTMLSKVAEALALRKAFPQDLSGLYTGEEMQQSQTEDAVYTVEPTPQPQPTAQPVRPKQSDKGIQKAKDKILELSQQGTPEEAAKAIDDFVREYNDKCDLTGKQMDEVNDWAIARKNEVKTAAELPF